MKKKVGILTLYGNNNFGNKLQNYALQQVLTKHDIYSETIIIRNSFIKRIVKKCIGLEKQEKSERYNSFIEFNKHINYTKWSIDSSAKNSRKLDNFSYLLYGSDQVWKYGRNGVSNLLIGLAAPKEKNIAIAASFGISNIPEQLKWKYKKGLNNFKCISVREERGQELVYELTGMNDAVVLIDPTMLLEKIEWQAISKKPKNYNGEKYILNYFLGEISDERKNNINSLANLKGWKIINILDPNDEYYNCGPAEFLYLEEHAELICTDSFHSCVFGILLDTPFIVFNREDKNESMNSRIETLLSKFELKHRKYNGHISDEQLVCDYIKCKGILDNEREKAEMFLKEALDITGE